MTQTVIDHVLARLKAIGIADVFGVPGDFAFPVNDAICHDPGLRWIGCTNELNAAYAADGYARIRGVAALCTTYGVGELSAINGIAGAFAEHLPVFHLVGTPNMATQAGRAPVHHTLGTGEFDCFRRMSEPVVCAHAVMTPQNVAYETERLIAEALYHRRPVYMAFPADLAGQPAVGSAGIIPPANSDPSSLAAAADAVAEALARASSACILPGVLVAREGLRSALQALVDATGLPFSTMFMDKSVLDEQQPAFVGMYAGKLLDEPVRAFVESCDRILSVGTLMTDFNTGAFTAKLDPARIVRIGHHRTRVDDHSFASVEMGDLLVELAGRLPKRAWPRIEAPRPAPATGAGGDRLDAAALFPRWAAFLKPDDIVVAETSSVSMGLGFETLPRGATFHNQTLWGSIGWATPAAVGAAAAAPGRRVLLFTGEGSHQLTVQEIGQFARLGLKPVVFVLNNKGYEIERLLCAEPEIEYNDIAQWNYAELPHAFGCEGWFTARVATCAELDAALARIERCDTGAYVEVVTDGSSAPAMARRLHDSMRTLYAR